MNTTLSHRRGRTVPRLLAAALLAAPVAMGVTLHATLSPAGPIQIGDQFVVDLTLTGWNAADGGVDAIAFFVDFDLAQFKYISASPISDGTEFLAEANQGAGYVFLDGTDASLVLFGRYGFGASDFGDATAGSIGGLDGAGTLGSLTLEAVGLGTGTISIGSNDLDTIFGDVNFAGITPTGGITLGSASMEVIPEPASAGLALLGSILLLVRRRRRIA